MGKETDVKVSHIKRREIKAPIMSTITDGFNPEIKLERTQTIMEGAGYSYFRYFKK